MSIRPVGIGTIYFGPLEVRTENPIAGIAGALEQAMKGIPRQEEPAIIDDSIIVQGPVDVSHAGNHEYGPGNRTYHQNQGSNGQDPRDQSAEEQLANLPLNFFA